MIQITLKKENPRKFTFDKVFDNQSEQQSLFDFCASPIVKSAFKGYNGTIFAYGQTGCGKTFTMVGVKGKLRGIIPRTFESCFAMKETSKKKIKIKASYLEIYNEQVFDLLNK